MANNPRDCSQSLLFRALACPNRLGYSAPFRVSPTHERSILMKTPRILLALSLGLALPALAAEPKVETDEQKTIYAIGLALAQSLQPYDLKPNEIELVKLGLT